MNNKTKQENKKSRGRKNSRGRQFDRNSKAERDNLQDRFAKSMESKGSRTPIDIGDTNINDPDWHAPNAQLLKDAASIPFSFISGIPYTLNYPHAPQQADSPMAQTWPTPGILSLDFLPTFGVCKSPTDPWNQANFKLYSAVRQATSGTAYYQAADMGIYTGAMMNAYLFYVYMCRAYGVIKNFSILDRYTPVALITAMHLDYTDLSSNLADFRMLINQYADRLASIALPTDIKYISRQMQLVSNVFTDSTSAKAQYYIFNPTGFYYFDETIPDTGGSLQFLNLNEFISDDEPYLNLGSLITIRDTILNPLIGSTSTQRISADILKSFGIGKLYVVHPISEDYSIQPVYSKEILSQIENATVLTAGPLNATVDASVTQNLEDVNVGTFLEANYVYTDIVHSRESFDWDIDDNPVINNVRSNAILNMHTDTVDAGAAMEATRLMVLDLSVTGLTNQQDHNTRINVEIGSCGSEVITSGTIYYYNGNALGATNLVQANFTTEPRHAFWRNVNDEHLQNLWQVIDYYALWSYFDWAPIVYPVSYDTSPAGSSGHTMRRSLPVVDLDNYTIINTSTLKNMNTISMLGLLDTRSISGLSS